MTGFGNDCFFQIIDQGREQFLKLLKFCQELQKRLRAGKVATAEEAVTPIDNLSTQLRETCKRLDTCVSGLCHLLEALPDDPQGENGAALVKLWKYNGKGGTETLLREALHRSKFYQGYFQDFLSRGTYTAQTAPKIRQLAKDLEGAGMDKFQLIQEAISKIPEWRKSLRAGALADFEKVLVVALMTASEEVSNPRNEAAPAACGISASMLETLMAGLSLFPDKPGLAQMHGKLQKFLAAASKDLVKADLDTMLQSYPASTEAEDVKAKELDLPFQSDEPSWKKLRSLSDCLSKCADVAMDGEMQGLFFRALWWHFKFCSPYLKSLDEKQAWFFQSAFFR